MKEKLEKGIKCLLFISLLNSCSFIGSENKEKALDYVGKNFKAYDDVYGTINDSIALYIDSSLKNFTTEYSNLWQVDSLIIIKSDQSKLIATINISTGECKNCKMDQVSKILGKKINGKWYFFLGGGHLIVPRHMYSKSEMNPLSFHELSQIARKEFLESALIKNEKGEYVVDDKWIDKHFYYNGMCAHCRTQAQYDSTHWYKIIHKWSEKIDTNEFKPLRKKINNPAL